MVFEAILQRILQGGNTIYNAPVHFTGDWNMFGARFRQNVLLLSLIALVVITIRISEFVDLSQTALERLDFIKSPTLRLAENTARSNFSERLTRMAWRRLYWGRLAAQRIRDGAPLADIDAAWTAYINSAADWNSEVMIFIVGLGKYYDAARREYFERTILNQFNDFDDALRNLRLSDAMQALRASRSRNAEEKADVEKLFAAFKQRWDELNVSLYNFALCFEAGKDKGKSIYCNDADAAMRSLK